MVYWKGTEWCGGGYWFHESICVLAVEGIGKGVGQESIGDAAEIRQLDTVFRHSIVFECKVAGGSADHGDLGV
jgi:hypothetical protein